MASTVHPRDPARARPAGATPGAPPGATALSHAVLALFGLDGHGRTSTG